MSELKVDTIKTYTPNTDGILFPNGLYVNNTKIAANNTIQTGQFFGTPDPSIGYPYPSGPNAMVSLGYFNSIIASITGASGLAALSAGLSAAEGNAKVYADNNFLRKNTNTEHNGGGLTFSGGPYTIFTNTTPTLNLRSNNPRLQLTETDTAGSTGTISMDSGVLKILYGDDLTSTNGLLIRSDGRVDVGFQNSNYRLTAIPTNSALGYGAVLGYATNTSYFGILGYNGNANTDNLPTSFYGSGYLFNSGKAKITDTLNCLNNVLISAGFTVTGNTQFNSSTITVNNNSFIKHNVDFTGTNVSWARGTWFDDGSGTVYSGSLNGTTAGYGLHGGTDATGKLFVKGLYMGHGGTPWANLRGLYITPDGNVGIGTNTPAVALDVNGEARSSISTTSSSNAKTLTTKDYVTSIKSPQYVIVGSTKNLSANYNSTGNSFVANGVYYDLTVAAGWYAVVMPFIAYGAFTNYSPSYYTGPTTQQFSGSQAGIPRTWDYTVLFFKNS